VDDFKAMGLYNNVERIELDLAAAGISPGDSLGVDDLFAYDQYHYEGVAAVASAANELGLGPDDRVLDIGSGLGGPARYLADRFGCQVTALEIQPDLHRVGLDLTERCGLSEQVRHIEGDILEASVVGPHTAIVSMLCFLHIPDRDALFGRCAEVLSHGGSILIDDYYARGDLTSDDKAALASEVQCRYLPSKAEYEADIRDGGFDVVEVADRTSTWAAFVADRSNKFAASKSVLQDRYGSPTVDHLDRFYRTVAELFETQRLGGARFRATLTSAG